MSDGRNTEDGSRNFLPYSSLALHRLRDPKWDLLNSNPGLCIGRIHGMKCEWAGLTGGLSRIVAEKPGLVGTESSP